MSVSEDDIAIVGLSCAFPGALDINQYWDLLSLGKNAISHFSREELEKAGIDPIILNDPNYVMSRGILNNLDTFDKDELLFSEPDLPNINLQSKVFLKLVSNALKDAGIDPNSCPKETAVFSGANETTFSEKLFNSSNVMHTMQPLMKVGYARSLSAIVAYQFDLRGRAVSIHTGCSTSSVAVIQACEELQSRRTDFAIAGAVSIQYPERIGCLYEKDGPLSPNGTCRPFDIDACGTVLSNGAGVVVLKRLEDAMKSNDRIYCVIKGKAINNDGRTKMSFLAPSIKGQYNCIERAWNEANLTLNQIDYIEAHGSATLVGDPIEIFALKKTQNGQKYDKKWCGIGSVKSNIGHTTIASGMASIIKSALMIYNKTIVPTINFTTLNQNIDLDNTPFYIASKYEKLPKDKESFNIGVSNFGFGGTNTHLVLTNFN